MTCVQIKEENPRLARDSKVLRVTMDNVYEVFTTPRETTGLQGIHFRFMPDMRQVKHALQVGSTAQASEISSNMACVSSKASVPRFF